MLPVAALILSATVRQISPSLEEAAEISGAQWGRTFTRIIMPQMAIGLGAAIVVAFILAFGEIGATVLVTPPGSSTLPIHIYTMIANAPSSHVAALALMQTTIILVPLLAFVFLLKENPLQNRRHRVR
ncbi:ABC transporter permease subunit [Geotalea sp. SG265]|uniref:ABC transporter permease subunit n=1 Tax=Geotalea sp. SG265 TaxID=2922867 RepID=UPI001FAF819E|nr:ABC transporter permease subunit [Geotalea sp. SG265]